MDKGFALFNAAQSTFKRQTDFERNTCKLKTLMINSKIPVDNAGDWKTTELQKGK